MLLLAALLPGCASTGGRSHEVIGATIGGALGGGICAVAGGDPLVCTVAGVGGAVIGWGVTKAIETSAQRTQPMSAVSQDYRYQPDQGMRIEAPSVRLSSGSVAPGERVDVVATYVVLASEPGRARPVTETLSVWREGRKLREIDTQAEQRTPGEWTVERQIALPENVYPGTYEIRYEVVATSADGGVRAESASPLVVAAR
jgi:outer membrane lipoprotein SlyB